jgi:hypothetical protein
VVAWLAGDRQSRWVVDVGDREAVARGRGAVDHGVELGHARDLLHLDVAGAFHRPAGPRRPVGELLQHVEVVAEDLHRQVALHAGDQLVDPQGDGLRERVAQARDRGQVALDGLDQLGLVAAASPTAGAA